MEDSTLTVVHCLCVRYLALANRSSNAYFVTVQLSERGSFSTSPIHISLLEDRTFAWRTRIVSSQGAVSLRSSQNVIE